MKKILRSLIHECFPLQLRVDIELLSKRRNITNREKQDELFKLLRKYNLNNIGELGPGTNRYAFKLNGYVIKVATDNDGKIDNFKEFKMAKRLFPYVTKTYEVSKNGTLLVAEYIQPFTSFKEMSIYEDKIKKILTQLSTVYLIGDVGITSKNYANWGLRIGSDEPVCLDFAYIYDVSSSLFTCKHCHKGMLCPTADFVDLICQNPQCGQKYTFEDVRRKIADDVHLKEIGDLTKEGYLLFDSHVETELDENRSNYLCKKKTKKVESKVNNDEVIIEDNFIMEDDNMSNFINATISAANDVTKRMKIDDSYVIEAPARVLEMEPEDDGPEDMEENTFPIGKAKEQQSSLAFSGDIEDIDSSSDYDEDDDDEESEDTNETEEEEDGDDEDDEDEIEEDFVETNEPSSEPETPEFVFGDDVKGEDEMVEKKDDLFNDNKVMNAVSIFSNCVKDWCYKHQLFDQVKEYLVDQNTFPKDFYDTIQNCVFRGITNFLGFVEDTIQVTTPNGNKGRRRFVPPASYDEKAVGTVTFLSNAYSKKLLKGSCDNVLNKYREIFGNETCGLSRGWLEAFKDRLDLKLSIDPDGRNLLIKTMNDNWCVKLSDEEEELLSSVEEIIKDFHDHLKWKFKIEVDTCNDVVIVTTANTRIPIFDFGLDKLPEVTMGNKWMGAFEPDFVFDTMNPEFYNELETGKIGNCDEDFSPFHQIKFIPIKIFSKTKQENSKPVEVKTYRFGIYSIDKFVIDKKPSFDYDLFEKIGCKALSKLSVYVDDTDVNLSIGRFSDNVSMYIPLGITSEPDVVKYIRTAISDFGMDKDGNELIYTMNPEKNQDCANIVDVSENIIGIKDTNMYMIAQPYESEAEVIADHIVHRNQEDVDEIVSSELNKGLSDDEALKVAIGALQADNSNSLKVQNKEKEVEEESPRLLKVVKKNK